MNLAALKGEGGSAEGGNELEVYGRPWASIEGSNHYFYNTEHGNYVSIKKGEGFKNLEGSTRWSIRIDRPENMSFEEFMRKRIKFYTHFYDNDSPAIDKDYGEVVQEYSIQELVGLHKSEDPHFVIGSRYANCSVFAKVRVANVVYSKTNP